MATSLIEEVENGLIEDEVARDVTGIAYAGAFFTN